MKHLYKFLNYEMSKKQEDMFCKIVILISIFVVVFIGGELVYVSYYPHTEFAKMIQKDLGGLISGGGMVLVFLILLLGTKFDR